MDLYFWIGAFIGVCVLLIVFVTCQMIGMIKCMTQVEVKGEDAKCGTCGRAFKFENEMRYCPYCGKRLER